MKRKIAWALAMLLLLSLAGCGAKNTADGQEGQPEGAYSADGSVIFEKDGVTVKTAGLDTDPTSEKAEPIIWVDVENTGAQDAYLGVAGGSVNGVITDVQLIDFYMENGEYYGGNYDTQLTIPAESSGRYALGYSQTSVPGVDISTLGEMEFCFTTSEDEYSWYSYMSEPVVIVVDASVPMVDITGFDGFLWGNDQLDIIVGEQDYDDWFGPEVYVYMKNKSDHFVGVSADSAEVDGVLCDYLYGGLVAAPGKVAVSTLSFDGEARELKGFENLTLNFSFREAKDMDSLTGMEGTPIDPITVTYPPQVWGEYENDGLKLEIQPKYNDLVTVETDGADDMLFSVSETASLEAGGYDGAGWLFGIGKVDEEKLHGLLCYDMSGMDVFAKDSDGSYYVYYHPTDVRYARATNEEMERDQAQWTMLCEWAESMKDKLIDQNGLERAGFGNSTLDTYVARAAWEDGVNYTISTTEFGPVAGGGVDATRFAEFVLGGYFGDTDAEEAPDGEYVVLNFPDEDVRIDFFFAPDAYARVTSDGVETLYQAGMWDDNVSYAEAMQGWYYALAEKAGVKPADESLTPYLGTWAEKIAGRGMIEITPSVAPGKATVHATWPNSAAVMNEWELLAVLGEDGRLVYENGHWNLTEYDENGEGATTDESYEENGYFYLDGSVLRWHDDRLEREEDSEFLHID